MRRSGQVSQQPTRAEKQANLPSDAKLASDDDSLPARTTAEPVQGTARRWQAPDEIETFIASAETPQTSELLKIHGGSSRPKTAVTPA